MQYANSCFDAMSSAANTGGPRAAPMNAVVAEAQALRDWLFGCALPLWWEVGADRVRGGFHEAIDLDGTPVARPRHGRNITRKAFSYWRAGRTACDVPFT